MLPSLYSMSRRPLLLALLLSTGSTAWAQQPPDPTLIQGRDEFDKGTKELNLGHYEAALSHYEASYRLTNKPALLYNLGYVNRQLFQRTRSLAYLEQAIERYKAFLEIAANNTDPKVLANKERAEKELQTSQDEFAREQASRAKGEEGLTVGEGFLKQGRIDDARTQLDKYERAEGNERQGVVRAWVLRAGIAVAERHLSTAAEAYAAALELDRSVILPREASEDAAKAFAQAQARLGTAPVLAVSHTAPGSSKPGMPVDLAFTGTADPMNLVRNVVLHYRAGSGAFSTMPTAVGKVTLPRNFTGALLPGAKIEYYGDVVDRNGAVLEHLGTASLPFVVEVERPTQTVLRKWWFWTVTGGILAVAAVAAGVGYYLANPPPPDVPFTASLLHW
jgi:tetratricopeptide (TPR) repeat protein